MQQLATTDDVRTIRIDGDPVPALGFGTWQLTGDACLEGVRDALSLGYRHIDTAQAYGNERGVADEIVVVDTGSDDEPTPRRILVAASDADVRAGLTLATALWLFMMLVYSPIIGWGVFGFGSGHEAGSMLHLGSPIKYIVATLVLHLIYGWIIGGLNPAWIQFGESRQATV